MTKPADPPPAKGDAARRAPRDDVAALDRELNEIDMLVGQARDRGDPPRAEARPGGRELASRGSGARRPPRRYAHARHAHPPRRPHGGAGRRPRGQAPGARPPPRRDRRGRGPVADLDSTSRGRRRAGGRRLPPPRRVAETLPPSLSRVVLNAQEDLRREIARSMHDGPAQSLTNIVLQAQIVERLLDRDPDRREGRAAAARADGPADARRDQELHLRRPADGARRPGPRAHAPARRRATAAGGRTSRSSSTRWARPAAAAWTSRARCSGSSTRRSAPTSRSAPERVALRLDWTERARGAPRRPSGRRAARRPRRGAAGGPDRRRPGRDQADDPGPPRRPDARPSPRPRRRRSSSCPPPRCATSLERAGSIGATVELLAGGGELRLVVPLPAVAPAERVRGGRGERMRGHAAAEAGPGSSRPRSCSAARSCSPLAIIVFFGGALAETIGVLVDAAHGGR